MCTLHRSFSMPTNAEWVIVFIIRCSQIHIIFFFVRFYIPGKKWRINFFIQVFFPGVYCSYELLCVCLFYISVALFSVESDFFLSLVSIPCVLWQWWKYSRLKTLFSVCSAINLFGMVFCPWPMHAYDTTVILFFGSKPTFLFWFDVWLVFDWCFEK